MTLSGMQILVADDQLDVARTLCAPLRSLGATLTFVADAHQALAGIESGRHDACITDMKMEPAPWGGLWLLNEMQSRELRTPTIVLSGEGAQRQTIEAMRLGASDWVDKTNASIELAERCAKIISVHRAMVHTTISATIPFPLSVAYSDYFSAVATAAQFTEGLKALEESVRLSALVSLATLDRRIARPARVTAERIARPSLGTWVELSRELARSASAHPIALTLMHALGLDRRAEVDRFVQARNDLQHGGAGPMADDLARLDSFLEGAAARVHGAWPYRFATPVSMEWDGTLFRTHAELPTGSGETLALTLASGSPLQTGRPLLTSRTTPVCSMWPWMTHPRGENSDRNELLLYDGVHSKSSRGPGPEDALSYTSTLSRTRGQRPEDGGRWEHVARDFGRRA